jgi:hypothetical protein
MKAASQFVEAMDALDGAIKAKKFHGYLRLPIPHELDAIPEQLVRSCLTAEQSQWELLPALTRDAASVLLALSERQATLAVRVQSQDILTLSILAVGLAAIITDDEREGMLVMPLAWHTAGLLGLEPKDVFAMTAAGLPLAGRRGLSAFASRKPQDQTLKCMGYIEGADADGFRYIRNW